MAGGIGGKLTDIGVKAFIGKGQRGKKLADGGGLYLFLTPAGGTSWRMKYRIDGKEKTYSIGPYPQISLAAARVELGELKALLREGKDPVTARRVNRASSAADTGNTFTSIAKEWLTMKQKEWSPGHHTKSARAFERDIYPAIGNLPIASITPAIIAKAVENIHKRDAGPPIPTPTVRGWGFLLPISGARQCRGEDPTADRCVSVYACFGFQTGGVQQNGRDIVCH